MLLVDFFAMLEFSLERQRRAEVRIDAACALGLAGRQAQQPAVVKELALGLQRIEPGLLDSPRVEMRVRTCRAIHSARRFHTANASSV